MDTIFTFGAQMFTFQFFCCCCCYSRGILAEQKKKINLHCSRPLIWLLLLLLALDVGANVVGIFVATIVIGAAARAADSFGVVACKQAPQRRHKIRCHGQVVPVVTHFLSQ